MKNIKNLIIAALLGTTFLLATQAHAVLIAGIEFSDNAIADQAVGVGSFRNWNPALDSTGVSQAQLQSDMTDTSPGTYVFGTTEGAFIDMTFNNVNVHNGSGNDLAVFFVGNGSHTGNLRLLDGSGRSIAFGPLEYTGYAFQELFDFDGNGVNDYSPIYVGYFDLDVLGINSLDTLNQFRLEIGNRLAVPSLMAAINTTPVPIPPSVLLLLSGLAALGMVSRRRSS